MSPASQEPQTIEASAPCSLRLAESVGLALDRRVSCRLELGGPAGVELELRDGPVTIRAAGVAELPAEGLAGELARLLSAAGLEGSVRLATQARVPEGTGLGVRAALAVCVAATLLEATEGRLPTGVPNWLSHHHPGLAPADVWTSLLGGAVAMPAAGASQVGERLPIDPARVEEGLLLIETGLLGPASREPLWSPGQDDAVLAALRLRPTGRVPAAGMRSPEPATLASDARLAEMVDRARELGAAAWLCAEGRAGLLGLWGGADARRELLEQARRIGLRPVACRLDLLGLEVRRVAPEVVRG